MLTGELVISGTGEGSSHHKLFFAKDCDQECQNKESAQTQQQLAQQIDEGTLQSGFKVRVNTIDPQPHTQTLSLRGRSGAFATITHRAETAASVTKIHVVKGQKVNKDQLLCSLDQGARKANLIQAETQLEQAQFEYDNGERLIKSGHITPTKLQQLKVGRDSAAAALKNAQLELSRIEIFSAVEGIISDDLADEGDFLNIGGVCASVVQLNPLLAIAQLPEYELGYVNIGDEANVNLVTGENAKGKISFISPAADPLTRTFRTEISLPNSEYIMRDGVTANININVKSEEAYLIPAIAITLSETGDIGVKIIDEYHKIQFQPLTLFSQSQKGVWARPIGQIYHDENSSDVKRSQALNVITVGQDYVLEGEEIKPHYVEFSK